MIKVAGIIKNNEGKLCVVRKKNTDKFIIPGGRVEAGETDWKTLKRELKEELDVDLIVMSWFGKFNGLGAFEQTPLEIRVYHAMTEGIFEPSSEIEEIAWIDRDYIIPVGGMLSEQIIPAMIRDNVL